MPKAHHRSRSSIDRAIDLLADLDDHQLEILLQEANSTVTSNVAVAQAINLFEKPLPSPPTSPRSVSMQIRPPRKFLTSLSPRKNSELRRRQSNRISSAPEPRGRLTSPGAEPHSPVRTSRSYKRISRPFPTLTSPTAAADIRELLIAYLTGAPSVASSSSTSSPITPRSFSSSLAPIETDTAGLDLFEPSPNRATAGPMPFGSPMQEPMHNISGIFEVLGPVGGPSRGH